MPLDNGKKKNSFCKIIISAKAVDNSDRQPFKRIYPSAPVSNK